MSSFLSSTYNTKHFVNFCDILVLNNYYLKNHVRSHLSSRWNTGKCNKATFESVPCFFQLAQRLLFSSVDAMSLRLISFRDSEVGQIQNRNQRRLYGAPCTISAPTIRTQDISRWRRLVGMKPTLSEWGKETDFANYVINYSFNKLSVNVLIESTWLVLRHIGWSVLPYTLCLLQI